MSRGRVPGRERLARINLAPDIFAVVMATGIVSVAADDHGYWRISVPLGLLATAIFVVLLIGLLARLAVGPRDIRTQARDPDVALRMFTFVAACAVLATRWHTFPAVVWLLGAVGAAGWLVLVPLALVDVRSRERKDLRDHAHGAWLLPSVATAGLATTAADLALHTGDVALIVLAGVAVLIGIVGYLAVAWLIAWRALNAPFVPDEVTPDSWILMGALAITVLAADHLLAAADAVSLGWLAAGLRPLALTVLVLASGWIPVLLYAEMWRVDAQAGSLHYQGVWWAAVFPIGMYSAAASATAAQLHLPALWTVSLVSFWIAATSWLLVAAGLLHADLARAITARRRRRAETAPDHAAAG